MLYKTHQKYGKLSGLVAIPVGVAVGVIPTISLGMRFSDAVTVGMILIVAMLSASFGSEFPDCDSPGSIPARKHPFIASTMRMFGIKHRGKFTHDYFSLALFFGAIFAGTYFSTKHMVQMVASGNHLATVISQGLLFLILYNLGDEMVSKYKFIVLKGRLSKGKELLYRVLTILALTVILTVSGFINPLSLFSSSEVIGTTILTATMLRIFVVFSWVGAYSHLFADMLTNEGVSIFGLRLAPAKVVLKLKKIPLIGPFLLQTDLKTGSAYEDFCSLTVSILTIPVVVLVFISITGGNIIEFLSVIGLL